ncbi:hypothetical protein [Afipia sp. GAS231]|uniref:hypothetical protein n=1 Tax=Afipia sp. GAS231 TaxID=1882747 RepID=UPI0012F8C962|nr:hypothetical protein [Afipia sp. GAS231]
MFSDFIGGPDEEARKHGTVRGRRLLQELLNLRGEKSTGGTTFDEYLISPLTSLPVTLPWTSPQAAPHDTPAASATAPGI